MQSERGRFVERQLSGWGNFPKARCRVYRPERNRELRPLVTSGGERHLIACGARRSYGDASLNAGNAVVDVGRLNRLLAFDDKSGVVRCEAGVTFDEILEVFVPRGWFPPVTPGTRFVTIGGAVACDVYGKNHYNDGSIGNHVLSLELLVASGEIVRCSRLQNPEIFWATVGGMGLTGIMTAVEFKLRPIKSTLMDVGTHRADNIDKTLEILEDVEGKHQYSVAWIDGIAGKRHLGRGVVWFANHSLSGDLEISAKRKLSIPVHFPGWVLNHFTVRNFNRLYYHSHPKGEQSLSLHYDRFFYPLDSVGSWNRMYGKRGFLQYQCVLPTTTSRQGLVQILEAVSESSERPFLAVLNRFGRQQGLLSFPMPGFTLALDFTNTGSNLLGLLSRLDEIVLRLGGRIYLAKDARLEESTFKQMYGNLSRWLSLKASIDPENKFSSDLSRRLCINS